MTDKTDTDAWRAAFDDRHEFDVYPEHFMSGLRNEFCAGWHAALKSQAAGQPKSFTGEQIAALEVAANALIDRYAEPIRAILCNAEIIQPKALTDDQIRRIWLIETGTTEQDSPLAILDFARAIIAATEAK